MHCKTCNYPLWNMRERRCPECGSPFSVSDFHFVPSAVQFRCPHCSQDYYGTEPATGHLVPNIFECVKCRNTIGMNDTIVLPTEGVAEEDASSEKHPWLERQGSTFKAWLRTVGMSCFRPGRLIELTRPDSPGRSAFGFFIATLLIVSLLNIGTFSAFVLMMSYGVSGPPVEALGPLAVGLVVAVAVISAAFWAWLFVTHLALELTGETAGLRRTMHAMAYSCGPLIVSSVPCLGGYVLPFAMLWWIVNAGYALKAAHGVKTWRGIVAAIALPGLLIAGLAAFIGWLALH